MLELEMKALAQRAKDAGRLLARKSSAERADIVRAMAEGVEQRRAEILRANSEDIAAAIAAGMTDALVDRLRIDERRLAAIVAALRQVAELPDPVGELLSEVTRPNGLRIRKERVPIGVICMIYESRPNVTADTASLCIRTGNAVILRGGSEAFRTNRALAEALVGGGAAAGLPDGALAFVQTTDRAAIQALVQLEGVVDLVIPRGGEALIRAVVDSARVPVIKHYKGVCHLYLDATLAIDQAIAICVNAKCQRPGVCNAIETLLVHEAVAASILPRLAEVLRREGVELRGDEAVQRLVPEVKGAGEEDWYAEYLDLVLAIRIVADIEAAVAHINHYGSHHSDAIVTTSDEAAARFVREVDSAVVYVNASTRFTDGGEFGFGAEIGISTDKLHARGPMGLQELTTYRYVVLGNGQVRA